MSTTGLFVQGILARNLGKFTDVEPQAPFTPAVNETGANARFMALDPLANGQAGDDFPEPHMKPMILPSDAKARKGMPITTGVLDYFPLALAEVAKVSKAGNDQHNPGQPLHWSKDKSTDHADCIPRHLIDRGTFDPTDNPPQRHSAKLAWRALALLQIELENELRGAK